MMRRSVEDCSFEQNTWLVPVYSPEVVMIIGYPNVGRVTW